MKPTFTQHFATVMMLAAWLLGLPAAAQDSSSKIKTETEQLQQSLSHKPVSDPEWNELKPDIAAALDRSRAAQQAGRLYLGLEELGRARRMLRSVENEKQSAEVTKQGLAGFEAEWKKAKVELTSADQGTQRVWNGSPAAVRAMAESAHGQVPVLVEASKAYASVTSPDAGFYYLGEAKAGSEFATFCYQLHAPRRGTLFSPRSIQPELQALQDRVNAAFQPPGSIDKHREFIRLNATLKLAGELNTGKLYAGALYQYLDGMQQFAMLDAASPDDEKKAALRRDLAKLGERLKTSKEDDSIGQLFVERAEALLDKPSPDDRDWKTAGVIAGQVLPSYFAAKQAAPIEQKLANNLVTVTLVRWPYT